MDESARERKNKRERKKGRKAGRRKRKGGGEEGKKKGSIFRQKKMTEVSTSIYINKRRLSEKE